MRRAMTDVCISTHSTRGGEMNRDQCGLFGVRACVEEIRVRGSWRGEGVKAAVHTSGTP